MGVQGYGEPATGLVPLYPARGLPAERFLMRHPFSMGTEHLFDDILAAPVASVAVGDVCADRLDFGRRIGGTAG